MDSALHGGREIHPDRCDRRSDTTPAVLSAAPTLGAALADRARREPAAVAYYLPEEPEGERRMTVGDLYRRANAAGAALQKAGLARGDSVCLSLDTCADLVAAVYGAALVGAVPMLAEPPLTAGRRRTWLERLRHIADVARPAALVCAENQREAAEQGLARHGVAVVCPPFGDGKAEPPAGADPQEPAFIQFSSGTTASAKGVVLSHRGLTAAVAAIGSGIPFVRGDTMVSWLPLHHDMGIVAGLMSTFLHGVPCVLASPLSFATAPLAWLRLIHRYRGTVSSAPNFAYRLVASAARPAQLAGLDLSCWRSAFNGAEVVDAQTLRDFHAALEPCGFRAESLRPCYGMAEIGLAATLSPIDRAPRVEVVSRIGLSELGRAQPPLGERDRQEMVSCGHPVGGMGIRIADPDGRPVPEGRVGTVMVAGESMMTGYIGMPDRTAESLRDGWLDTGDLGFLLDGELFVSGRAKDLLIIAGRNHHPQPIELAVASVKGVRPGTVAAVSRPDPEHGTEQLVLVVESRLPDRDAAWVKELREGVERAAAERTGVRPGEVVLVPPRTLPKTSSGKLQRSLVADWLARGEIGG